MNFHFLCARVATFAFAIVALSSAARADDCSTILNAMIAQAKTSYASTIDSTIPGLPADRSEMVVAGGKMYMHANGTWTSSTWSAQDMIDLLTAASKKTKMTCQKLGPETVDGQGATLYSQKHTADAGAGESRVWISDRTGLPLKSDTNLGKGGSMSASFRYEGVKPPAGVN